MANLLYQDLTPGEIAAVDPYRRSLATRETHLQRPQGRLHYLDALHGVPTP